MSKVRKLHNDKENNTKRNGIWKITNNPDGSTTYQVSKRYLRTLSDSEILKLSKTMGVR